jgi:uncharacterized protein
MKLQRIWQATYTHGMEHLILADTPDGFTASGLVIGVEEGQPFQIRYGIDIDQPWGVRAFEVTDLLGTHPAIRLLRGAEGAWIDEAGLIELSLNGCIDIDISVTPFTNTLPIRRLKLAIGQTQAIDVVYIRAPQMRVERSSQRYTRLGEVQYRFETGDFRADVTVDQDGLVMEYPGLFTRVWSG